MIPCPHGVTCLRCGFKPRACSRGGKRSSMCGLHLYARKIQYLFGGVIQSHFLDKRRFHRRSSHLHAAVCNKPFLSIVESCEKAPWGCLQILLLAPEDVSPFISAILTITPVMSAQAASLRIPFSTSHTQIGRCLSLLFQLYFSRLRCRRGTCFLDNAIVISPVFQVPLIWADMKTLHVCGFFPPSRPHYCRLSDLLSPHHGVLFFLRFLNGKCGRCLICLSSSCFPPPLRVWRGLPVEFHVWQWPLNASD